MTDLNSCTCVSSTDCKTPITEKGAWGIYTYDPNSTYDKNDWVIHNGVFYKSLVNDNTNNLNSVLFWKKVDISQALYDVDPNENGKLINGKLSTPIGTIILVPKSTDNQNLSGYIDLHPGEKIPTLYKDLIKAVGPTFPYPPELVNNDLPVGTVLLHLGKDSVIKASLSEQLAANGWSLLNETTVTNDSAFYSLVFKTNPDLLIPTTGSNFKLDPSLGSSESRVFPCISRDNVGKYKHQTTLEQVNALPTLFFPPIVQSYQDLNEKDHPTTFNPFFGSEQNNRLVGGTDSLVKAPYVIVGDTQQFYVQRNTSYNLNDSIFNFSAVTLNNKKDINSKYFADKISPDSFSFNALIKKSSSKSDLLKNYKYVILAFNKVNTPYLNLEELLNNSQSVLQDNINTLNSTLVARFEKDETKLNDISGNITKLTSSIESGSSKVTELSSSLTAKIEQNSVNITALENKLDPLIDKVELNNATLTKSIADFRKDVDTENKLNTQKFSNLDSKYEVIVQSTSTTKVAVDGYLVRINGLKDDLDHITEQFSNIKLTVANDNRDLSNLKYQVNSLQISSSGVSPIDINSIKAKLTETKEKAERNKTELESLTKKLEDITNTISQLKKAPFILHTEDPSKTITTISESGSNGFIPSDFMGKSNDYYLGKPDKLTKIEVEGTQYYIPLYEKIV